MTENQLTELRDLINYATTIPYHLLSHKDKACFTMSVDMAWWGTQKMNGDFQMKESDKKLKASGFNPSEKEIRVYFKDLFHPAT